MTPSPKRRSYSARNRRAIGPGVFREMHRNLGTIYLEQHEYDKAREKCEQLKKYGEVGRLDAEDLLQRVQDGEAGKTEYGRRYR